MKQKHLPKHFFLKHFARNLLFGIAFTLLILLIGMLGFKFFEKTEWLNAYVNSAMIISGVGTLDNPKTEAGKLFVGTYSIIGGGSFLLIVAAIFSPIFHWLFRQVQVEDREHF